MKTYSLTQAATKLGQSYYRVYWVVVTRKVKALEAGRSRMLAVDCRLGLGAVCHSNGCCRAIYGP